MNSYFLAAAVLTIILGVVHSILGEQRIFQPLRHDSEKSSSLKQSHIRILWVTWHFATLLGWGYAAMLFYLTGSSQNDFLPFFKVTSASLFFVSSLLVFLGTRARHLGWLALLIIAVLIWLG